MTDYKQLKYDNTKVQVESAIRDEEGYSLKGCYAKKNEIKDGVLTINTNGGSALGTFSANQSTPQTITLPNGSVQLLNQSVTFVSDNTYEEFPYRASVTVSGISSSTYAEVVYSNDQAESMNYASFVDTDTNVIYIYSRTNVGTVTIPTISIGMDYSDITIDATPTSGSGNAVSSGGVYTALTNGSVTKIGTTTVGGNLKPVYLNAGVPTAVANDFVTVDTQQTITATKIHKYPILVLSDNTDPFIMITSAYPRFAGKNPSNLASANGMLYQMFGYDSRDKNYIQIDAYRRGASGLSELHHYIKNESGGTADLCVFMNDTGTGWAQAPYRAFNTSNSADIVTVGSLLPSSGTTSSANIIYYKSGRIVTVIIRGLSVSAQGDQLVATGLPVPQGVWANANYNFAITDPSGSLCTLGYINYQGYMYVNSQYATVLYGSTTYII